MTPDFEQIKQRAEAATPGPWKLWNGWGPLVGEDRMACERIGPDPDDHYEGVGIVPGEGAVDIYASRADFEFVAAARDDIPALLAVIDELTAKSVVIDVFLSASSWAVSSSIWAIERTTADGIAKG